MFILNTYSLTEFIFHHSLYMFTAKNKTKPYGDISPLFLCHPLSLSLGYIIRDQVSLFWHNNLDTEMIPKRWQGN